MKNREHIIGLFQGMFEQNILTFNPWRDQSQTTIEWATDIRTIQSAIEKKWITFIQKADKDTQWPASCTLTDPDGNIILIDQHI
jgi:RimJ/RimL family protein N-acetyltransferase